MNRYMLTRKNRLRIKRHFMLFRVFLVFISGMLPSFESMSVSAESDAVAEPIVSKDIDGEDSIELHKGKDFNYHVKVIIPEDISGYESMYISDESYRLII